MLMPQKNLCNNFYKLKNNEINNNINQCNMDKTNLFWKMNKERNKKILNKSKIYEKN